jgi:ADP-ribose pyrophosphatase YjhB (NUDIX family)
MKFVNESIEDILKPKPREEIEFLEKEIINRTELVMDFAQDSINLAENEDKDSREYLLYTAFSKLQEAFFTLPEYLQDKFSERYSILSDNIELLDLNESLLLERKKLALSSGFVIIQDNKILLVHPTNSKWYGTYSIPKGHIDFNEDLIDTAIRETTEEIGITINPRDIVGSYNFIDYVKDTKVYKRVYYFVVNPSIPIKNTDFKLQKSEVDWAGFLSKKEASKRIFWRLNRVLSHLK